MFVLGYTIGSFISNIIADIQSRLLICKCSDYITILGMFLTQAHLMNFK